MEFNSSDEMQKFLEVIASFRPVDLQLLDNLMTWMTELEYLYFLGQSTAELNVGRKQITKYIPGLKLRETECGNDHTRMFLNITGIKQAVIVTTWSLNKAEVV